ncbi:hypothetical protein Tco_1489543 [Tanacetum coccineum]
MSFPYEGVSCPLYTKEEWYGSHAPESNILCKDIFKDPDVCRKALDRTIILAELRRTESLLPLELSNRVKGLGARLLSSDVFHAALAHVASLGINYGVERGLRMGRTDADFEAAARKFSNFHIGAEADFNKALVAFPTTPFPFLGKVVAAAGGALSEVTQILLDKLARSATPAHIAPPIVNEASDQVPHNHASDDSASSI